jgi:hypothetical protein
MRRHSLFTGAIFLLAFCANADTTSFAGGKWFDCKRFVATNYYMQNGVLVTRKPAHVDRTVDVTGKYIVPPFGEAHNHNVDSGPRLDGVIASYLRDGIFYVKNPNNLPRTTPRDKVNKPDSIDATFAMGSLTVRDGHPALIMKRNLARGAGTEADADGGFYFTVANEAELEQWRTGALACPSFAANGQARAPVLHFEAEGRSDEVRLEGPGPRAAAEDRRALSCRGPSRVDAHRDRAGLS